MADVAAAGSRRAWRRAPAVLEAAGTHGGAARHRPRRLRRPHWPGAATATGAVDIGASYFTARGDARRRRGRSERRGLARSRTTRSRRGSTASGVEARPRPAVWRLICFASPRTGRGSRHRSADLAEHGSSERRASTGSRSMPSRSPCRTLRPGQVAATWHCRPRRPRRFSRAGPLTVGRERAHWPEEGRCLVGDYLDLTRVADDGSCRATGPRPSSRTAPPSALAGTRPTRSAAADSDVAAPREAVDAPGDELAVHAQRRIFAAFAQEARRLHSRRRRHGARRLSGLAIARRGGLSSRPRSVARFVERLRSTGTTADDSRRARTHAAVRRIEWRGFTAGARLTTGGGDRRPERVWQVVARGRFGGTDDAAVPRSTPRAGMARAVADCLASGS